MRVAALIPARKGSKGVPGKNRRVYRGWPLWRHAYHVGLATCDRAFVSTDDEAIADLCNSRDLIMRPPELCRDETPMIDVVRHFCTVVQCDLIVLLQPTQPLRKVAHVRAALELMERTQADSVVSVCEIPAHMSPDWALDLWPRKGKEDRLIRWSPDGNEYIPDLDTGPQRRQDCERAYYRDGTVYVLRPKTVSKGRLYGANTVPLVIPPSESCSIDTEEDWARLEASA